MFGDFVWWQGVVEDRDDPLKLGRVRVRILGYHTDNKDEIPTNTLPWATPSQPITSAAMNGIGTTPTGVVEGTWVFGFFRDGKNAQEPVMFGTFGGIPEEPSDPKLGFNDPNGIFPRESELRLPDTNRLATGNSFLPVDKNNGEDSPSLKNKRKSRHLGIPTAIAGDMKTSVPHTDDSAFYEPTLWNEPNPRYGGVEDSATDYLSSVKISSIYPYNHVRMSESGHLEEWDDTESAERMHRYHRTGTFEEIQPDGTKVTKIVGNEYEITLGYKDVLISGTCNVTIEGDCRMMIGSEGNSSSLVQEVYGDYHLHVHGDKRTKIHGNEITEVLADRKIVINGEDDLFVGKNQIINIADNLTYTVGGNLKETVKKDVDENYGNGESPGNHTTNVYGSTMLANITGKYTLTSKQDMKISCTANYNLNVTGNSTINIDGYQSENVASYDDHTVGGYFKMNNSGTHTVTSGGNYAVTAPRIDLN
jgi:hypothetical protein